LSSLSSSEYPNPGHLPCPNVSIPVPAIHLTTINAQAPVTSVEDLPVVVSPSSGDVGTGRGAQLQAVQRAQFLSVDQMKHAVSIETITSNEDDHFL